MIGIVGVCYDSVHGFVVGFGLITMVSGELVSCSDISFAVDEHLMRVEFALRCLVMIVE